jgi:hypothetical protein
MANKAAQQLGRRGGKARAANMTAAQRRESARKAGIASGKARRAKARKNRQKK